MYANAYSILKIFEFCNNEQNISRSVSNGHNS